MQTKQRPNAKQTPAEKTRARAGPGGTPPPLETALAKTAANLAAKLVCDEALQIHGGYGFTDDYLVSRLYRGARYGSLGGGTSETLRDLIGKANPRFRGAP